MTELKATQENYNFSNTYTCTIGVDFKKKFHNYEGHSVELMIWDTAGQERYHHINRYYYNGCQGVILVYDITNPDSFEKVNSFLDDFRKNTDGNVSYVLVGNKSDSVDRKISFDQGKTFAEKIGMPFIECSAFTGENIEGIFDLVMAEIKDKEIEPSSAKNFYIVKTVKKQKKCCD